MAPKPTKAELAKDTPTSEPERRSPMISTFALLMGFVLLVVAGVFTVVVPELSDAGDEAEDDSAPASDAVDEPVAPVAP